MRIQFLMYKLKLSSNCIITHNQINNKLLDLYDINVSFISYFLMYNSENFILFFACMHLDIYLIFYISILILFHHYLLICLNEVFIILLLLA